MVTRGRRLGFVAVAGLALCVGAVVTLRARAADEAKGPRTDRVASVQHVMAGIHGPRNSAINELLKGDGPKDDKAWADLALHAALLNESGHLLMENGRCPDGVWAEATGALRKGSAGVFEAAAKKDLVAARDSYKTLTTSCQVCHAKFKDQPVAVAAAARKGAEVGGAEARQAEDAGHRVATVRHLMAGINAPNCSALGEALKNNGPKDDKGWQDVVRFASLLNEAGFLLIENKRCPDDTWKIAATDLRENSAKVAEAGVGKKLEEARTGFKGVTAACAACHAVHKKPTS